MTRMQWYKDTIEIRTQGKGLYKLTAEIEKRIRVWAIQEGMCFLFIQHASASLAINESYDPSAQTDLETFMDQIAPEDERWHQHTLEGGDDSPAHIRTMLTNTDLTIPIDDGKLSLGSWQGVYVFEHRRRGHVRRVLLRCWKIT